MTLTFIPPQLPTLMEKPPEGSEWIHEIKYDGYRTQLIIEDGSARIFTRNGHDWTARYPAIEDAAAKLGVQKGILDGEAVILVNGKPDYHALRRAAATKRSNTISLVAFDILHIDGHDLRQMPLEDRRHLLADLVGLEPGTISFSQGVVSSGASFYQAVDKLGLEGMVSKRADSRYVSGRSTSWLKIKCYDEAFLQVMGLVRKPGQATQAILADHEHRYVGKAAVTLNNKMRERLWERVKDHRLGNFKPGRSQPDHGNDGAARQCVCSEELRAYG